MSLLERLRQEHPAGYITAEEFLAEHLPHITSVPYLRRKIRLGQIDIKLNRIDPTSKRSRWVIYLNHLAEWLDRQTAADAA
ncbi:pyocin activator PrtN family protein [Pseudomonas sp. LRF_L74]|uniref:pyocin activator PrtN family protein n=1 Tax=Pseudomonas sp. LRF_L74 TaxID=3369422 RepID=UPI003F607A8B